MKLPAFEYLNPKDIPSTLELLALHKEQATLLAGGTDLLIRMKQRLALPGVLINLKDVEELKGIAKQKDGALVIGSLTRLTELLESSIIKKKYPGLHQAVKAVAAPPLQAMGTVGGNLLQETRCLYYNQTEMWRRSKPTCYKAGGTTCNAVKGGSHCFATYQGDLAPMLIALNARIVLARKGESRTLPLEALYSGKGKLPFTKNADELLEKVILPPPGKHTISRYEKLRLRQALDYPLVGVAVRLTLSGDGKTCEGGRLVLTGIGSGPILVDDGQRMANAPITDTWINELSEAAYQAAKPVPNVLTPPAYRKRMTRVLTRRALNRALGE